MGCCGGKGGGRGRGRSGLRNLSEAAFRSLRRNKQVQNKKQGNKKQGKKKLAKCVLTAGAKLIVKTS